MSIMNAIVPPADTPSAAPAGSVPPPSAPVIPTPTTAPAEWLQAVPEGWRADPNLTKYKSMEDFLGGHKSLVSKLGERATEVMVKDPSEYTWKREGLDEETISLAKSVAHQIGLSNEKAAKVLDYHFDTLKKIEEQHAKTQQESLEAMMAKGEAEATRILQEKWGAHYDTRIRNSQSVLNSHPDLAALCDAEGLHNSAAFIQVLDGLYTKFGMDRAPAAPPSSSSIPSGDAGFSERLKSIETHPDFENPGSPNYHILQQQRMDLYRQRYG